MVGNEATDTTKSKFVKGTFADYLQQVRRTPGIFPKAASPQTAKLGKV